MEQHVDTYIPPEVLPQQGGGSRTTSVRRGRLSTNLLANAVAFALSLAVGVLLTPYMIRHLGIAAYGLVPLSNTVTSYLAVITLVFDAAVARFITMEFERNDVAQANRYFNTSLFTAVAVVAALAAPGMWLAVNVDVIFRVPVGLEGEARGMLGATVAAFLLSVVAAPFEVAPFCRNRFDVKNAVTIVATALRVALVVLLFSVVRAKIWHVGLASALAAATALGGALYNWRRLTPELTVDIRSASRACLKELVSSGGWIAINQLGTLLLLSIDLVVVNRYFGPEESGKYASLLQWPIVLRGLGLALSGVVGPSVIALCANSHLRQLVLFSRTVVKSLGLLMALPVGLVSGLAGPILNLWLGPSVASLTPLLAAMVLPMAVNLGYLPLHHIATATNNVKVPGLVQVGAGVTNLALAVVLGGPAGMGVYGVALAGIAVLTLRNIAFTPYYAAALIGQPRLTFMREVRPIVSASIIVFAVTWGLSKVMPLTSWLRIIGFGAVIGTAYAYCVWRWGLSAEDKKALRR